jgi:hypothetical protein
MTNHNDFNFSLSFDGEAPDSELKDDDFYNRGFRKLSFAWGHLFHCLRGEVEVEYDFENSGATVMFGFGPDVFRGSLPHLRNGL